MKLYRIYKHINTDYNHLYIEVITDESHYDVSKIFTMKWQQSKGEHQYYGFTYDFSGRNSINKFYKITKKIEKENISSSIQPYEMVLILEKMGFRQCEYYDSIGFIECKKVKNPNNFVYHMTIDGKVWTTKLANKRTYKKQIIKNSYFSIRNTNGFSKVEFEISQFNDKVKSIVEFDIKTIHREYILYKGTDEEKEKLIRKEKLERIIR